MHFSRKLFALTTAWASLLSVTAESPMQSTFQANGRAQEFRMLTSDLVKGYAVRVKQPISCEQGVQYSGYIDNLETDDHAFFSFFESRIAPRLDPTVLWLNGGPGCSSMMGQWMELGPCLVTADGNATVTNPYSWNTMANVIFLDQPVNVGYSYGKSKVKSTKEAARDVYAFLQLFFDGFPEYSQRAFHIAGESYGGHYLPALATEIINNNKVAKQEGKRHINFESMLIGNGWTDPLTQFEHYQIFGCAHDNDAYKPLFDEETCQKMKQTYPRCKSLMERCYKNPSPFTCIPANMYCENRQTSAFDKTGLNPYDIREKCQGNSGLCYDLIESIETYANREDVKASLGVDAAAGKYTGCSDSVGYRFASTGDGAMDFSTQVAYVLTEGVRVLLYVGDMDWICNWSGNKAWSLKMDWHGKEGYNKAEDKKWISWLTGETAGEVRAHGNLTFLKIYNAGHMVPYDQPANAVDFYSRWLVGMPLHN